MFLDTEQGESKNLRHTRFSVVSKLNTVCVLSFAVEDPAFHKRLQAPTSARQ